MPRRMEVTFLENFLWHLERLDDRLVQWIKYLYNYVPIEVHRAQPVVGITQIGTEMSSHDRYLNLGQAGEFYGIDRRVVEEMVRQEKLKLAQAADLVDQTNDEPQVTAEVENQPPVENPVEDAEEDDGQEGFDLHYIEFELDEAEEEFYNMEFSGPSDEVSVNANRLMPTAHSGAPLQTFTTMVEPNFATSVDEHSPSSGLRSRASQQTRLNEPRASPRTMLNDLFDPSSIQSTSQISTTEKSTEGCSSKQSGNPKPKSRKSKKGLTISDFVESDCKCKSSKENDESEFVSLVGTHHHNLEVHSLNAAEMTNRPQNKQFWVNADGKEIYHHDAIRLEKADIDAIVARECNIPEHVLHDRVRMLASASRNEIATSCTNHIWYATHNNYGCTYFSCGYLYYNFHWSELNWLTPNSPMNDHPSWLTCVNIQDGVKIQYRDMVFGVLKYVQVIGQQLGYRKDPWPIEEIEKIDIPGAHKIKRWIYNVNFFTLV